MTLEMEFVASLPIEFFVGFVDNAALDISPGRLQDEVFRSMHLSRAFVHKEAGSELS